MSKCPICKVGVITNSKGYVNLLDDLLPIGGKCVGIGGCETEYDLDFFATEVAKRAGLHPPRYGDVKSPIYRQQATSTYRKLITILYQRLQVGEKGQSLGKSIQMIALLSHELAKCTNDFQIARESFSNMLGVGYVIVYDEIRDWVRTYYDKNIGESINEFPKEEIQSSFFFEFLPLQTNEPWIKQDIEYLGHAYNFAMEYLNSQNSFLEIETNWVVGLLALRYALTMPSDTDRTLIIESSIKYFTDSEAIARLEGGSSGKINDGIWVQVERSDTCFVVSSLEYMGDAYSLLNRIEESFAKYTEAAAFCEEFKDVCGESNLHRIIQKKHNTRKLMTNNAVEQLSLKMREIQVEIEEHKNKNLPYREKEVRERLSNLICRMKNLLPDPRDPEWDRIPYDYANLCLSIRNMLTNHIQAQLYEKWGLGKRAELLVQKNKDKIQRLEETFSDKKFDYERSLCTFIFYVSSSGLKQRPRFSSERMEVLLTAFANLLQWFRQLG